MRKFKSCFSIINAFVLSVFFIGSFSSCSSDDQEFKVAEQEVTEYDELMNSLEEYSADFTENHPIQPISRGGFKRFWKSVKADYGAYSDAKGVRHEQISISASRKHWHDEKLKETLEKIENTPLSRNERTVINNQIDSLKGEYAKDNTNFGALHNAAIFSILLDDDMDFETTEELVSSTVSALSALGFNTDDVDIKTLSNDVDCFFDDIYSDNTDVMFDRLAKKYPEKKQEYKILNQYLSTVENYDSPVEIQNFTKGYVTIINKSKVSAETKAVLNTNISIAPASHQLWMSVDELAK